MAIFALQALKNLNASQNGVLAREGLSFELSRVVPKLIIFHDDHLNYSDVKQTTEKTNESFYWGRHFA